MYDIGTQVFEINNGNTRISLEDAHVFIPKKAYNDIIISHGNEEYTEANICAASYHYRAINDGIIGEIEISGVESLFEVTVNVHILTLDMVEYMRFINLVSYGKEYTIIRVSLAIPFLQYTPTVEQLNAFWTEYNKDNPGRAYEYNRLWTTDEDMTYEDMIDIDRYFETITPGDVIIHATSLADRIVAVDGEITRRTYRHDVEDDMLEITVYF